VAELQQQARGRSLHPHSLLGPELLRNYAFAHQSTQPLPYLPPQGSLRANCLFFSEWYTPLCLAWPIGLATGCIVIVITFWIHLVAKELSSVAVTPATPAAFWLPGRHDVGGLARPG